MMNDTEAKSYTHIQGHLGQIDVQSQKIIDTENTQKANPASAKCSAIKTFTTISFKKVVNLSLPEKTFISLSHSPLHNPSLPKGRSNSTATQSRSNSVRNIDQVKLENKTFHILENKQKSSKYVIYK